MPPVRRCGREPDDVGRAGADGGSVNLGPVLARLRGGRGERVVRRHGEKAGRFSRFGRGGRRVQFRRYVSALLCGAASAAARRRAERVAGRFWTVAAVCGSGRLKRANTPADAVRCGRAAGGASTLLAGGGSDAAFRHRRWVGRVPVGQVRPGQRADPAGSVVAGTVAAGGGGMNRYGGIGKLSGIRLHQACRRGGVGPRASIACACLRP